MKAQTLSKTKSPTPKKSQSLQEKTISDLTKKNQNLKADLEKTLKALEETLEALEKTLECGDNLAGKVAYALAHFRLGFKKSEKDDFEKAFKKWIDLKTSLHS